MRVPKFVLAFLFALIAVSGCLHANADPPNGEHEGNDCVAGDGRGTPYGTPICTPTPGGTPTPTPTPPPLSPIREELYCSNPNCTSTQVAYLGVNPSDGAEAPMSGGTMWEVAHPHGAAGPSHVYFYMSGEYMSHSGSHPGGKNYYMYDKHLAFCELCVMHQGPPLNLSCGPATSTSVKCSWQADARGCPGGYNLYNAGSVAVNGVAQNGLLAHLACGTTTATISGLTTGTTVYVYLTDVTVSTNATSNVTAGSQYQAISVASNTGIMGGGWVKICDNGGANCGLEKVAGISSGTTFTLAKPLLSHTCTSGAPCPVTIEQAADGFDPLDGMSTAASVYTDETGFKYGLSDSTLLPNTTHEFGHWLSDTANAQGVTAPHGKADTTTVQLANYSSSIPSNNPNPVYSLTSPSVPAYPQASSSFTVNGTVDEYNSSSAPTMYTQYNPNCCGANTWTGVPCTLSSGITWTCTSGTMLTVQQAGHPIVKFCQGTSNCTPASLAGAVNNRSAWESNGANSDSQYLWIGGPNAQEHDEWLCWVNLNGPDSGLSVVPATINNAGYDGCRIDDWSPMGIGGGHSQPDASPVDSSMDTLTGTNLYWPETTSTRGPGNIAYGLAGLQVGWTAPIAIGLGLSQTNVNQKGTSITLNNFNENCANPPGIQNVATILDIASKGNQIYDYCDAFYTSSPGALNYTVNGQGYQNQLQMTASTLWASPTYRVVEHPIGPTTAQMYSAEAAALSMADCVVGACTDPSQVRLSWRYMDTHRWPMMQPQLGPATDTQQQYIGPCSGLTWANDSTCDYNASVGYYVGGTCQAYVRHFAYGVVVYNPGTGGFNRESSASSMSCALGGTYYQLNVDTNNRDNGGTCTFASTPISTLTGLGFNTGWIGVDAAHRACN